MIGNIRLLIARIEAKDDLTSARKEILDIIETCLQAKKDSLGNWEKTHFINAIAALGLNVHSLQQPTFSWLRLCLIDLEKAMMPITERDPNYQSHDPSISDVDHERLMGAVDSIGRELG